MRAVLAFATLAVAAAAAGAAAFGAHRSLVCDGTEQPAIPIGTTRAVIRKSACPAWSMLGDRWIVTLERDGRVVEVFRSHTRPWPSRLEVRGKGGERRLLIHTEPRSLDGTGGLVEVPLGADGLPSGKRL